MEKSSLEGIRCLAQLRATWLESLPASPGIPTLLQTLTKHRNNTAPSSCTDLLSPHYLQGGVARKHSTSPCLPRLQSPEPAS